MKKSAFTSIILSGLTASSLACYIFLSVAASSADDAAIGQMETTEKAEQKVLLPDVSLAKRLLNITKIVMPRD